jgi:preprotein translocase subunit SecE
MEEKAKLTQKTKSFFTEVRSEMKKVTWPNRRELYGATSVAVTVTIVVSALVGMMDAGLGQFLKFLVVLGK